MIAIDTKLSKLCYAGRWVTEKFGAKLIGLNRLGQHWPGGPGGELEARPWNGTGQDVPRPDLRDPIPNWPWWLRLTWPCGHL